MRRGSRLVLLIGFLAAGLLNCCDDGVTTSGGSEGAGEYFPLGATGTWTYDYYGPEGSRVYLSVGNPASSNFTIGQEFHDSSGVTLYKLGFPPHCGLGRPGVPYPFYVDSIAPRGIADETDPIQVHFNDEVRHILDISIASDPEVVFEEPSYSADSAIVSLGHAEPFQSYENYELWILLTADFEGAGVVEDSVLHRFRTTQGQLLCLGRTFSYCATDDRLYRSLDWLVEEQRFDPDSFAVLLEVPPTVGREWTSWSSDTDSYEAEILSVGPLTVGEVNYDGVVEVAITRSSDGVWEESYWFAPGVGVVRWRDENIWMELAGFED